MIMAAATLNWIAWDTLTSALSSLEPPLWYLPRCAGEFHWSQTKTYFEIDMAQQRRIRRLQAKSSPLAATNDFSKVSQSISQHSFNWLTWLNFLSLIWNPVLLLSSLCRTAHRLALHTFPRFYSFRSPRGMRVVHHRGTKPIRINYTLSVKTFIGSHLSISSKHYKLNSVCVK